MVFTLSKIRNFYRLNDTRVRIYLFGACLKTAAGNDLPPRLPLLLQITQYFTPSPRENDIYNIHVRP